MSELDVRLRWLKKDVFKNLRRFEKEGRSINKIIAYGIRWGIKKYKNRPLFSENNGFRWYGKREEIVITKEEWRELKKFGDRLLQSKLVMFGSQWLATNIILDEFDEFLDLLSEDERDKIFEGLK